MNHFSAPELISRRTRHLAFDELPLIRRVPVRRAPLPRPAGPVGGTGGGDVTSTEPERPTSAIPRLSRREVDSSLESVFGITGAALRNLPAHPSMAVDPRTLAEEELFDTLAPAKEPNQVFVEGLESGVRAGPRLQREHRGHSVDNAVMLLGGRVGGLRPGQHLNLTGQDRHHGVVFNSAFRALGVPGQLGEVSGTVDALFT